MNWFSGLLKAINPFAPSEPPEPTRATSNMNVAEEGDSNFLDDELNFCDAREPSDPIWSDDPWNGDCDHPGCLADD